MMEPFALLALTILGTFWLFDRHQHRAWRERENDRQERARLTNLANEAERAHRDQIATLLQRIQAPEAAVVQHIQATAADENPYPLNEEEQAQAQDERLRIIAEIERMEREENSLRFIAGDG